MKTRAPSFVARIRNWLATLLFWPAFGAILILFDLAQRAALLVSPRHHKAVVSQLNKSIVALLRAVGVRITVLGEVPALGRVPVIIVSNHQSLFDIPIVHSIFSRLTPRWVAKKELARGIPSISINLRRGGNVIIDRSKSVESARTLNDFGRRLHRKKLTVALFPEGTRSRDGKLRDFRIAGLGALLKSCPDAVLLPVTIDGAWKVVSKSLWPLNRDAGITVALGPILEPQDDLKTTILQVQDVIASTLARIREMPIPLGVER